MKDYDKVIFVSTGNTAVGPMTEAIMQDKFRLEDILVESRGLVVLFPEPINPKAEAILVRHGLSMKDHTSVPFDRSSFDTLFFCHSHGLTGACGGAFPVVAAHTDISVVYEPLVPELHTALGVMFAHILHFVRRVQYIIVRFLFGCIKRACLLLGGAGKHQHE